MNGDKCDIIVPALGDWSRAIEKRANYNNYVGAGNGVDVFAFIIVEICRFNGQKKEIDFVLKLSGDIYFKLTPILSELMNETV